MSSSIVIPVVPKYVIAKSANSAENPIDEIFLGSFLKGVDTSSECESSNSSSTTMVATGTSSRKRKLDHLSVEEKIQRKKLKNRVAAQTSRDRKKAKMEDMECEIEKLRQERDEVFAENRELKHMYTKLERRLGDMERRLTEQDKQLKEARIDGDIAARVIGSVTNSTGSAVSTDPLPQGLVAQSIIRNARQHAGTHLDSLIRIIALCVAWKSASTNSTVVNSKSWPTACLEILQPKLREMVARRYQDEPLLKPKWEPQPLEPPLLDPIWM